MGTGIKTSNLRPGNWMMGKKPVQISEIVSEDAVRIVGNNSWFYTYAERPYDTCLDPIEIDEDHLLKAGFVRTDGWCCDSRGVEKFEKDGYTVLVSSDGFFSVDNGIDLIDVEYLHELQNNYEDTMEKTLNIEL